MKGRKNERSDSQWLTGLTSNMDQTWLWDVQSSPKQILWPFCLASIEHLHHPHANAVAADLLKREKRVTHCIPQKVCAHRSMPDGGNPLHGRDFAMLARIYIGPLMDAAAGWTVHTPQLNPMSHTLSANLGSTKLRHTNRAAIPESSLDFEMKARNNSLLLSPSWLYIERTLGQGLLGPSVLLHRSRRRGCCCRRIEISLCVRVWRIANGTCPM